MPKIGDIVDYVLPAGPNRGEVRPAIVVRLWDDGTANLQVFVDGSNDGYAYTRSMVWATNVVVSEKLLTGTWRLRETELAAKEDEKTKP